MPVAIQALKELRSLPYTSTQHSCMSDRPDGFMPYICPTPCASTVAVVDTADGTLLHEGQLLNQDELSYFSSGQNLFGIPTSYKNLCRVGGGGMSLYQSIPPQTLMTAYLYMSP